MAETDAMKERDQQRATPQRDSSMAARLEILAKRLKDCDYADRGTIQCGTAGNANLVRFNGEDIVGCAHVYDERDRLLLGWLAENAPRIVEALSVVQSESGPLTLDTERQVFFYEQDNYPLSNFSSFRVMWAGIDFDSSEHAYHWDRFKGVANMHQAGILMTRSAHEAFRYAQANKAHQRPEWDQVKVGVMREILRAKASQHEYVRRKLLQTGERELIENSWRDAYWGWGPIRDGQNMLGKLWMQVRAELRGANV